MAQQSQNHPFGQRIGSYELFFKKRYKVLYTLNDFLIGLIFLIGSFFFFKETLMDAGTWLFVVGSALLLIRPTIRLVHDIHLRKVTNDKK